MFRLLPKQCYECVMQRQLPQNLSNEQRCKNIRAKLCEKYTFPLTSPALQYRLPWGLVLIFALLLMTWTCTCVLACFKQSTQKVHEHKHRLFDGFKSPLWRQGRLMWFCAIVSTLNHMLFMPFPSLSCCLLQKEQNNPNVSIFRKDVKFMKPQL